ncbi:nucleoside-diphosphate sugar epimerase/dehydratase [Pelosinus sp. UFO1]|uniref:polysaccharide biosynthesis protein n=1 Tax=Pelosinus sp. UFO1 TaxID=484770 RepID=UPI0004D112ED|nr:nucleoside-diphosphate sugar epimerase/dehydratase [Pelosinus sp. UFO1]AIF53704.1 polysaccharide biosynthesis protein CapD [Pelosinus sp. UFO1]
MRRKLISIALLIIDMIIVATVPFIALIIRFEGNVDFHYYSMLLNYMPAIIIVRLSTFYALGLYNRLWRYASINELLTICSAVTVSSLILFAYMYTTGSKLPRSVHILSWFFNIGFIGLSRLVVRIMHYLRQKRTKQSAKVLIIGAGDAGAMIAREINHRYYDTKRLIGFIDDDQYKNKQQLFGAAVLGNRYNIKNIVIEKQIDEIIIAMPSAGGGAIREIIHECKQTKCILKILPGMYELIDGDVTIQQLRNVEVEDLLGRDPVKLDVEQIAGYLKGKRVLVTGAGGSIGSELCRQIAKISPSSLTLLGKGENSIYEINSELREKFSKLDIEPIIADVRDKERIHSIFSQVKPQVVFHAAAHKHVPLMESQPMEAVRNNIFGTKTVAEAADEFGAEAFVMISTDKAVNPTSVMGATKRVAELIIQNLSKRSNTKFVAVRFGNVLGSRGSVIPLFKKQIAKGGPITITHPDMQRYFMTIPEASQLVLQAGAIAKGGEVFVLDMGEPVKIIDMACDLIELSGLVPHEDIKIKFSGLRPGEKLFEELLTAEEGTASTKHQKIFVANLKVVDEKKLYQGLVNLESIKHSDEVIEALKTLLPTYQNPKEKNCYIDEKISVKNHPVDHIVHIQTVPDLS